ncbi:alpha-L-rhamnosidase [Agromyces seonyuensis]|uniref:alpha-L-rhamnosidase n=1 Tax=Agromyces seonyuensis TaxID=2662446 RepID=A0A6I4NSJ5_9MICO|nr:alpha-L-rhamnosidase [Agromyces seonyuensis]MWB97140.1 family 78 glycoside hydrolase catalytic domain [Agromyces seonyuensis]
MSPTLPSIDATDVGARVLAVRTQYPADLLGVPLDGLRLTWRADAGSAQLGYQVRWSGDADGIAEPVASADSIGVAAPGGALTAGAERRYSVRIATEAGWSDWSDALVVEAAVPADSLVARPIAGTASVDGPVELFRTGFTLPAAPVRARLRATFWGVGDLRINGARAVAEHLNPGWTSYQDRLVFGTWDVTDLLHEGENALGVLLGDGWYRTRLGWLDQAEHYGTQTAALVQLDVDLADGSSVVVGTSPDWKRSTGAIKSASLYDGVEVDLRDEPAGWDVPGFDDAVWPPAVAAERDLSAVEPRLAGGVVTVGEWGVRHEQRPDRVFLDAGQNIAGWLRLRVTGKAGDRVVVRHAEILEPDGSIHTFALRTAKATDTYILAVDGESVLEPLFTFHGFQYAEVTGADVLEATAVAISSAVRERSSFASAEPRLDRLHANVAWSQLDNFVSLPTDCPQRDERLGWTGDAQAFAPTASTLFDVEAFWMSWLRDLELEQDTDGSVPAVVPNILVDDPDADPDAWTTMGRAGWGDAATFVPWAVYESYGSDEVLVRQLDSMRRWVRSLEARAGDDLLPSAFQFGDWLDPDAPGDKPWEAKVSRDFMANAFFAHSARLLGRAEELVGDPDRAAHAHALADRIRDLTWARYGEAAVETQTGAAVAIVFALAPEAEHERIAAGLARNVAVERGRIATGFLGTPLVLPALARFGHLDEAYLMLLRSEAPSWLYQVEMGATTVWERWDALAPDGSIHTGEMATGDSSGMLSFNHYAYGAVIDWVYRHVGGLGTTPDAPGYRRMIVAPRPATSVRWGRASVDTRLGTASVDWRLDADDALEIDLVVPFGSEAVLDLARSEDGVVEVDGALHDGGPIGPGTHTVRATGIRIADPLAVAARLA